MNRIKSFFNSKMWHNVFGGGASKISFLSRIFAAGGIIVPIVLGISAGWLGSVYIEYSLEARGTELQQNITTKASAAQSKRTDGNGLINFLRANPFSISALKDAVDKMLTTPVSKDNGESNIIPDTPGGQPGK